MHSRTELLGYDKKECSWFTWVFKKDFKNLFISLILWEYHILYFDSIHLLSSTPPRSIPTSLPPPMSSFLITYPVQFMLPKGSWLWGHPLEHGQTSRGPTLKENQFSLSRQLSAVLISSDGMELDAHLPLHTGIPVCSSADLVKCVTTIMSLYMQLPCSVWKALSHPVVHVLWLLQTFCSLFCNDNQALCLGRYDMSIFRCYHLVVRGVV